jgi:hypothetical protein
VSDNWIAYMRNLIFIGALFSTIENTVIPPEVLDAHDVPGSAQMLSKDDLAIQVLAEAADRGQALPGRVQQEAEKPSPQGPDLAREVESLNKQMDDRDDNLGDLQDIAESLTETAEDRRRRSLDELSQELLTDRQADLEGLQARQKEERDDRSATMTEQRKELKKRYAGSPDQEGHLEKFDQLRKEDAKEMADEHNDQIKQLDQEWQQKFKDLEEHPEAKPSPPPKRDRDDDDDRWNL